eukprot:CAMPEP_0204864490 /NCGR_PEP_ID=MMETSP1348-20121228/4095_1 /ASSEMBLY_ACC=CAM_ASM_000700 /TAXON_ID=215587 /ORGANISM="Aplanochytrium stocchinoi, Strain GSBS06" /LENGTH=464 /DNA_ID=CAMNT_0052015137 /DNA_START=257 /DNA_END=1648 /DNA_ORIENTATION=+
MKCPAESQKPSTVDSKTKTNKISLRDDLPVESQRRLEIGVLLPVDAGNMKENVNFDASLKVVCMKEKQKIDESNLIDDKSIEKEVAEIHKISEVLFLSSIGDLERLKKCVRKYGVDVSARNFRDYDKRTALHIATACGCYAVTEWLVQQGVNINAVDGFLLTPLASAARNRHKEVVRFLQENGAKVLNADGEFVPLAASPLNSLIEPHLGADIGEEWEISADWIQDVKVIGKGQFGEVHVVKWKGATVVAKVLKEINLSNNTAMAEFRAEIDLQHRLHHPNITQFFGVVLGPPTRLIVEYLEGGTLNDKFQHPVPKGYSYHSACNTCLDIVKGLIYLHTRKPHPVIHRDLKPANLLFDKSGRCKIADFGLSKSLKKNATRSDTFTMTGETGTYRYMAPEVFRHQPYGTPVDIYAFSMVAYQCFTWTRPFSGMEGLVACKRALNGARPSTSLLPKKLEPLFSKAW